MGVEGGSKRNSIAGARGKAVNTIVNHLVSLLREELDKIKG